jgi:transposase InsO family protein
LTGVRNLDHRRHWVGVAVLKLSRARRRTACASGPTRATSDPDRAELEHGSLSLCAPPYTPRWNGKLERVFGTLDSESAHGRVWPDSTTRDRALSSFLRFYNRRRPHSAAGGRPPITRVQHVREQDT